MGRKKREQMIPEWVAELTAEWRARADEYERDGVNTHLLLRRLADDLEASATSYYLETLTVAAAAEETGYTPDYLYRALRAGTLLNVGGPKSPRVRRSDLPRKAGRTVTLAEEINARRRSA